MTKILESEPNKKESKPDRLQSGIWQTIIVLYYTPHTAAAEQGLYCLLLKYRTIVNHSLTHLSLASHKRGIGKQSRPRSDDAERGVWSGLTLFAFSSDISTKHDNNKN